MVTCPNIIYIEIVTVYLKGSNKVDFVKVLPFKATLQRAVIFILSLPQKSGFEINISLLKLIRFTLKRFPKCPDFPQQGNSYGLHQKKYKLILLN